MENNDERGEGIRILQTTGNVKIKRTIVEFHTRVEKKAG